MSVACKSLFFQVCFAHWFSVKSKIITIIICKTIDLCDTSYFLQLKCKSAAEAAHRPVRFMSDLPLYKRTWRLNQTLRERKQQVELLQSLDSLKRVLGIEEDVTMSTQDLLREVRHQEWLRITVYTRVWRQVHWHVVALSQARQMIGSLEQHGTSLMAKKRILIRQYSHYQTLISQRSGANGKSRALQTVQMIVLGVCKQNSPDVCK